MKQKSLQRALTRFEVNSGAIDIVSKEVIFIALIAGVGAESFVVGILTFVGIIFCLQIPIINSILCLSISLFWGYLGFHIGKAIGEPYADFVIGLLFFWISSNIHFQTIEYVSDYNHNENDDID